MMFGKCKSILVVAYLWCAFVNVVLAQSINLYEPETFAKITDPKSYSSWIYPKDQSNPILKSLFCWFDSKILLWKFSTEPIVVNASLQVNHFGPIDEEKSVTRKIKVYSIFIKFYFCKIAIFHVIIDLFELVWRKTTVAWRTQQFPVSIGCG